MSYILAAIIGIVVWQIVCLIVYELTNEDEDILEWMTMFVPVSVIAVIGVIYKIVIYRRKGK